MYIVKNNTAGKVVIGDLNLVILHGEEKDLERLYSRETILKSNNLRYALEPHKKAPPALLLVKDEIVDAHADALKAMEKRIRSELAEQMQKLVNTQKNANNDDLGAKMDLILKALQNGVGAAPKTNQNNNDETETFEDDDKMLDIHKKAIERLSRNSQANISSTKSEAKDTGVDNTANELEGLI